MKQVYTTTMINTGGRSGESHSPNHSFKVNIEEPGSKTDGTNPEQLFAAGYSACFNSALDYIKRVKNINDNSIIKVRVSLYNQSKESVPDVVLGVEIEGFIANLPLSKVQELLDEAHQVCPYSRATRGNILVTVQAVPEI